MSSDRDRRQSNLTVEQKVGARASDRWYPMRQMIGKDRFGQPVTKEIYVDMRSGAGGEEKRTYEPEGGWNDPPPNLPAGDPGREGSQRVSDQYRARYDKIDWSR